MELAGPRHLSDPERERQRLDASLRQYEGLIFTTAQQLIRAGVEFDVEDVQQVLRIKAWKAICAYDPEKARGMDERRYVFMCIADAKKDIAKKKRRGELMIEDIAPTRGVAGHADYAEAPRDRFDERYLSTDHEQVFGQVEDELPLLPNTLTDRERLVLLHMYRDHRQTEIAVILGISKREVESAVRSIRTKMADWRPSEVDQAGVGSAA